MSQAFITAESWEKEVIDPSWFILGLGGTLPPDVLWLSSELSY